jgi:GGDEF domain-containing protein
VLVIARDGIERSFAAELVAGAGFQAETAERLETIEPRHLAAADAVLFLPRRAPVPAEIGICRLRALAPGCGIVVAGGEPGVVASWPSGLGPGLASVDWPAAPRELRRALRLVLAAAAAGRAMEELRVPPATRAGVHAATALGGVDGHPIWFLDAVLSACATGLSGGAVLAPATDGFRPLAVRGIGPNYVLRMLRRRPPAATEPGTLHHVRMGRVLRSTAAPIRAMREWWWMDGPPCAGEGALTFLFQVRDSPDPPWLQGTLEQLALGLLAAREPAAQVDLETGLERADAGVLARRALAVALPPRTPGADEERGAAVVLLSLSALRDVRRARGPRAEARTLAAAVGRIRRGQRASDRLLRLGPELLGLVVPAHGTGDADRLADRMLRRFDGGRLLRRKGEGGASDEPFELEVRAVFVDGSEDEVELEESLARLGVPRQPFDF